MSCASAAPAAYAGNRVSHAATEPVTRAATLAAQKSNDKAAIWHRFARSGFRKLPSEGIEPSLRILLTA